jgi:hypothetical protein
MVRIVRRVVVAAACLMSLAAPAVSAASDFVLTDGVNDFTDANLHFERRFQPAIVLGAAQGLHPRYTNVRGQIENITNGGAGARYTAAAFNNNDDPPTFQFARGRGTYVAPVGVRPGDRLGSITWDGYVQSLDKFIGACQIRVLATGAGTLTGMPGKMEFRCSTNGTPFALMAEINDWYQIDNFETSLAVAVRTPGAGTLKRVEVGDADSCGTGYRCLRVRN